MKTIKIYLTTVVFSLIIWFNGTSQGFYISGNKLMDANGKEFIIKGINVPLAWFVSDVNNNIANIKKNTGANCLRIVVTTSTSDNDWQTCVRNCINNQMIPMVELHDVTGSTDANRLNDMAKFWANKKSFLTSSDISKYILINIANEWGDWNMANSNQAAWRDAYKTAISTIRNAGINTTLVIDAPDWGQDLRNAETIRNYAKSLQDYDPKHNLLFSVHMYCEWANGGGSSVSSGLPAIKNAGIPIIVGEFGWQHDNGSGGVCDIPESTIISTCQSNGIGWLAWSWKGNGGSVTYLDLSNDWAGTSLTSWGNTVVWGSNGTKTAVTCSVFGGSSSGSGIVSGATYSIIARHSGKVLDVNGAYTSDGTNVQQWTNYNANNQKWIITDVGGGYYRVSPVHVTSKALDVEGASTADGANIIIWTYGGGSNQQWQFVNLGNGYYQIKARNSGKCLDVSGASTADGVNVIQWPCNSNSTNQQWALTKVSSRAEATTDIADFSNENVIIYPNPSNGLINISAKANDILFIYDLNGKIVFSKILDSDKNTIKLDIAKGMYIVKLTSGNDFYHTKLIIK